MNSDWTPTRCADFIEFNPRLSLKKGTVATKISMDKLRPFTKKIQESERAAFSGGAKFTNGDTIMARITPCLENGKTAFVDCLAEGEIAFGSTEFIVLRAKREISDARFLYYLATSSDFRGVAIKSMVGTSGRQRVQQSVLEEWTTRLPPLETQRKIAAVLSALDDKIELNRRIGANLEEQAAAIFKAWFVDYEPWNGERPARWEQAALGTLTEIKRGGSPRPIQDYLAENGLRWLKISDVTSLTSPFVLKIKERIKEEGLRKTVFLKAGELVLSNSATPGIPKILDVDTCIHDGWLYFLNSRLPKYYLYLFFKHIRPQLVALGNGSVFTNLKTDILKNYPVVQADDETLERFNVLMEPLFQTMLNADRECADLIAVRDAALPRLMSGEIDVSDVSL